MNATAPPIRRRSFRVLRWLLAIVGLVLLGIGVIAYQHMATLVRDTANRVLAPYDIEIVEITGLLPGRSTLLIATIDFRYAGQPHIQQLRDIAVDYRPTAVLRGYIDSLRVGEARFYSEQWPIPIPEVLTDSAAPQQPPAPAPQGEMPEAQPDTAPELSLSFGRILIESIHLQLISDDVQIETQANLQLDTFNNGALTLTGQLHDASLQQPRLATTDQVLAGVDIRTPQLTVECRGLEDCRLRSDITLTLESLQQPDLYVEGVSLQTAIDTHYQQGNITLRTTAPSELLANSFETGPHSGGMIELRTPAELFISYDSAAQALTATAAQLSAALPMLRPEQPTNLLGLHVDVHSLHGSYQLPASPDTTFAIDSLTVTTDLSVSQVYTNMMPYNIWSHRFDQQLSWQDQRATLQAQVTVQDIPVLQISAEQHWPGGQGQAQINVPDLTFAADGLTLGHVLSPLPAPGDLVAGQINAESRLSWQLPTAQLTASNWPDELSALGLRGSIAVSLNGLGGYYMETAFAGVSTEFRGEVLPDGTLRGSGASPLTIDAVEAGIPINNIHAGYQVDLGSGEIILRDIGLELFGGRISSEQFEYDLDDGNGELLISLDNIDLSQALSISAYDAVSATGLISGRLPVQVRAMTPIVTTGQLYANAPGGTIRYGTGGGTGNQSLDLVYQALEHYQFEVLEADVDYREDGELLLAVRMQGVSPQLNQGQRINLNLNISDNIPALLQSLQAGRSVTDLVERRLGER